MNPIQNNQGNRQFPSDRSLTLLNRVLIMSVLVLLFGFIALGVVYSKHESKEPEIKEVSSKDDTSSATNTKKENNPSPSTEGHSAKNETVSRTASKPTVVKNTSQNTPKIIYRDSDDDDDGYDDGHDEDEEEYDDDDDYDDRYYSSSVNNNQTNQTAETTSQPVTQNPVSAPASGNTTNTTTYVYKSGTYTTTVSYWAPSGSEDMGVSVTINNDIITNSSVINKATDRTSSNYQNKFIQSYSAYVNGKSISTLNLNRVAGASLTTNGFNDALGTLRSQARI